MIGNDFCPPGFGVPTDKELQAEKDAMHKKEKGTKPVSTVIDEQTKRLRDQIPKIGGRGWNMVGTWGS